MLQIKVKRDFSNKTTFGRLKSGDLFWFNDDNYLYIRTTQNSAVQLRNGMEYHPCNPTRIVYVCPDAYLCQYATIILE